MSEGEVINICREAIWVMLKLAGPLLLVGLAIGVTISLFQAMTQIQEMTLSFIPKMLCVFGVTIMLLPYMLETLGDFTHVLSDKIIQIGTEG